MFENLNRKHLMMWLTHFFVFFCVVCCICDNCQYVDTDLCPLFQLVHWRFTSCERRVRYQHSGVNTHLFIIWKNDALKEKKSVSGWHSFGVFGLSENECTFSSQIDSLHTWWVNVTNKIHSILDQPKTHKVNRPNPFFFSVSFHS